MPTPQLQSQIQKAQQLIANQTLPSIPEEVLLLKHELSVKHPNTVTIANLIGRNPEFLADFLQLVNKNLTGENNKITDARGAINIIGIGETFNIFISSIFMRLIATNHREKEIIKSCANTGIVAAELSYWVYDVSRSEAYTAGLLSNVGVILMNREYGFDFLDVYNQQCSMPFTHYKTELDSFSSDHATLSCLVGKRWQMPDHIVKAVLFHHEERFQTRLSSNATIQNLIALIMVSTYIVIEARDAHYLTGELKRYFKIGCEHLNLPENAIKAGKAALSKWGDGVS